MNHGSRIEPLIPKHHSLSVRRGDDHRSMIERDYLFVLTKQGILWETAPTGDALVAVADVGEGRDWQASGVWEQIARRGAR